MRVVLHRHSPGSAINIGTVFVKKRRSCGERLRKWPVDKRESLIVTRPAIHSGNKKALDYQGLT
jgi:hypothetical protein